ncbi:SpoIIE family protein phosphatase [Lutibacter sp. B2]|nr:SpoIIE family protein phosphatase [Lutibacter sp. B2]
MKKMKFISIRLKITGAMILSSLILALLISAITIFANYNFFKKETTEKLILLPQNYSNDFNSDFKSIEMSANTLSKCISTTFDLEKLKMNPHNYAKEYEGLMDSILKNVVETTDKATKNRVQGIYFTINPELTGNAYETWYCDTNEDGVIEKVDPDPDPNDPYIEWFYPENKDMCWYYEPIIKGQGVWLPTYEEADLNIDIISYNEPIYKDGVLLGVVGMDIEIDAMKNIMKNVKVYNTGYAFLMNNDYNFLVHPNLKPKDNFRLIVSENYESLTKEIDTKNSGIMNYKINKVEYIFGYAHLCNDWILAFVVPKSEVYSTLNSQISNTIIAIFLSTWMITLVAIYLAKSISNPIIKMTQLIKNTGKFNFSDKHTLKRLAKGKDEIGIMAREMIKMRKTLRETGVHKAAKLQLKSLQKEFPLPNKVNMELLYVPSKTVSGDFFKIEIINDHEVVGILWDVMGKGVAAAVNIYALNILFYESVLENKNPIDILNNLNIKVPEFLEETYIAACCFSFDFDKKIAKIAGAGINEYMYSSNKKYYQNKEVKGPFLGMFEDSMFEEKTIYFESGDKFYFLTDGLEFILSDEEVRKKMMNISDIIDLTRFVHEYIEEQGEEETITDDCTLVTIEIK